jgi:hypothetical protein
MDSSQTFWYDCVASCLLYGASAVVEKSLLLHNVIERVTLQVCVLLRCLKYSDLH